MKQFKVKFIREDAAVQNITVASDVDTQEETLDDVAQDTELVANTTPTLQAQDVDGLEDKDVMNYVYFNAPQDIDDSTRQALFNRADKIRQKQMNGSTTPKEQEDFAKGVIAAAAQTKQKATIGEALDYGVQAWIKALSGKSGKKGRDGSANWIGNNLYDEIEKNEDGRIHYYNAWIGKVDRENKIIYINDEIAPRHTVHNLIQAAHFMTFKAKRTHETRELIDMGFEDDDFDPMYDDPELQTEAYSSGRADSFNEPSWADASFDDEEDSTYRHSYIPSQTSEEFMKSDEGKKARILMPLKDAVADRIEEITDGEIDYTEIYDFVDDYIDRAHKKYNLEEMKKHSNVGKGKVDFFAKVILMKYNKQK